MKICWGRETQFTFLLHRRLVLYQYCAEFGIIPNVFYTELKAVWWQPGDVVCCGSKEPLREMVRSEAEQAKQGLTSPTVRTRTDRLLADSTWQSGGSENGMWATYSKVRNCRKLTFFNTHPTCSSRIYIDFINQIVQPVNGLLCII